MSPARALLCPICKRPIDVHHRAAIDTKRDRIYHVSCWCKLQGWPLPRWLDERYHRRPGGTRP